MILMLTEYQWKTEGPFEDGSMVLDLVPTVGGNLPVRVSIDVETRRKLRRELDEKSAIEPEKNGGA